MCKIFLRNKKLYEEKIKKLLNELVDHEKIKDVRICLSKVLKKIISNDKEVLFKDQNIHQICYKLKMDNLPIINEIFNNVNIKYNGIQIGNNNKNKILFHKFNSKQVLNVNNKLNTSIIFFYNNVIILFKL
jgi:hypothetical protein